MARLRSDAVSFVLRCAAVSALGLAGIVLGVACREQNNARQLSFDSVFQSTATLALEGSPDHPIFLPSAVVGNAEQFYVLDQQQAAVLAYGHDGRFLHSTPGRGQGPGELERPVTLALDSTAETVLVYDLPTGMVTSFDSGLRWRESATTEARFTHLSFRDTSGGPVLVGFGWDSNRAAGGSHGAPFHLLDPAQLGSSVRSGNLQDAYLLAEWRGAVNEQGQVFAANILGPDLFVFAPDGSYMRSFHVWSPSAVRFLPSSPSLREYMNEELSVDLDRLRQEPYSQLDGMLASDGRILTLFVNKNPVPTTPALTLDMYRQDGALLVYGMAAPGRLVGEIDGAYYFWSFDETDFGRLVITAYSMEKTSFEQSQHD